MNFLRVYIFMLILASASHAPAAHTPRAAQVAGPNGSSPKVHISKEESAELKTDLEKYKKQLKQQVLTHSQASELIKSIESIDKQMKGLENRAGITPLYERFDQLRQEICLLQRSNPQAIQILKDIKAQRKSIKRKTKREQSLIKTLTKKLQRANADGDQYEAKRISNRITQLQKEIAQKSSVEKNRMRSLNKQLAQIPAFKEKLQKVRTLDKEIYNKAKNIKEQMLQLKKQSDAAYERLNTLIANDNKVVKLKKWIAKTRLQLHAKAPCAPLETRYPDWVDNIA